MKSETTPHSDQKYVEALLKNDHLLVNEIYQKYSSKILGFVQKNNGSAKDAQDIFQEALIAIYQKAQKGGFVLTCPFDAYLYMVCRSKWINELKKRQRSGVTIKDVEGYKDVADATTLADDTQRQLEQDQLFEKKFKELGERCQEILRTSWKGIAMDKVAELLGVSYAYARKKKSECTARLMQLIKASKEYQILKT